MVLYLLGVYKCCTAPYTMHVEVCRGTNSGQWSAVVTTED